MALTKTQGVGNRTISDIAAPLDYDCSGVFDLTEDELIHHLSLTPEKAHAISAFDDWRAVDQVLSHSDRLPCRMIGIGDPEYPPLLSQIHDPPALIWVSGDLSALRMKTLSLVGTRNPTRYGQEQAAKWVKKLSGYNLCFCSGLARGVDTIIHQTALDENEITIAVLGSGIDRIYPPENRKLAVRMIKAGGAILTEYPPGTAPERFHFPERNRIVSGLSMGVIVIESAIKGGALITSRLALDEGREVFFVPHALSSRRGEGCNYNIKIGNGKLIQTPGDLFDDLPGLAASAAVSPDPSIEKSPYERLKTVQLDDEARKICEILSKSPTPLHMDQLIEQSGLPLYRVLASLLPLEIEKIVERRAGNFLALLIPFRNVQAER